MRYAVEIAGRTLTVEIDGSSESPRLAVDGIQAEISWVPHGADGRFLLLVDHRTHDIAIKRAGRQFAVTVGGREYSLTAEDERIARIRAAARPAADAALKELHAPMPGLVTGVLKQPGDQVRKGESLIIVEAMKMENELKAQVDGVIKEIKVRTGQSIDKNSLLVVFA